nr:transposase [Ktedonobacteraceae bacterium]
MNQRPSRHSLRLLSYDYDSPGAYFVTLCTVERKALFEQPDLRTILEETWEMLPQRFPTVKLDTFVIMPDHVHFILWLEENAESGPRLGQVVATY